MRNKEILKDYVKRINKVINHIENHLHDDLSLKVIANIACFSPFHFHRIFKAFVGETLSSYIQRLRIERAAFILIYDIKKSITDIAFDCGFSSSQQLAKTFKKHYSLTPSEFRVEKNPEFPTVVPSTVYNDSDDKFQKLINQIAFSDTISENIKNTFLEKSASLNIEVKDMPQISVIYIRYIGGFEFETITRIYNKLFIWAESRGLIDNNNSIYVLSWNDPQLTSKNKLRFDICLSIKEDVIPEGDIGTQIIADGIYAESTYIFENTKSEDVEIKMSEDVETPFVCYWLPTSGYILAGKPVYIKIQKND
ncbi:MAG: AraC family transcriptional regulator, partial [Deltaproteobacteria bacterium]|nr:AraC family transcriptional regulator [Deltaproteobacteria bacterium]